MKIVTYTELYQKDQTGKVRYWYMQRDLDQPGSYRSVSGIVGREDTSQQVSEWSFASPKNVGKVNGTTADEQAVVIINSTYRIRNEQGYAADLRDAGKKFFQPMLAAKYFALSEKKRAELFKNHDVTVQPKLDGQRCIVTKDGMFSRHGKEIISAPHIRKHLEPIFQKYPDLILDGELYSHDLSEDFNKLMSLVRKSKPTPEDLQESAEKIEYWIYDIPSSPKNFKERFEDLCEIFTEMTPLCGQQHPCVLTATYDVDCTADVDRFLETALNLGFEGAIVRLNKPYENKRTNSLLKVKKFEDEEFTIIDIEEGRGNLSGKAGHIIVDVDGKRVSTGLKFSHDEAERIWKNREQLIGKTATVRYFNRTPDGSLRFPKCVDIGREDWD